MEITLELIVFTVLAVFTAVSALLAVTTKRILRATTRSEEHTSELQSRI